MSRFIALAVSLLSLLQPVLVLGATLVECRAKNLEIPFRLEEESDSLTLTLGPLLSEERTTEKLLAHFRVETKYLSGPVELQLRFPKAEGRIPWCAFSGSERMPEFSCSLNDTLSGTARISRYRGGEALVDNAEIQISELMLARTFISYPSISRDGKRAHLDYSSSELNLQIRKVGTVAAPVYLSPSAADLTLRYPEGSCFRRN